MSKIYLSLLVAYFFLLAGSTVLAQSSPMLTNPRNMAVPAEQVGQSAGFNITASVPSILSTVIKAFLGLLGAIFMILMVYAGYVWMMAHGNEEEVSKAKETIRRAIIGLIIVVSAYAITYFIFKALGSGAGTGTSYPP